MYFQPHNVQDLSIELHRAWKLFIVYHCIKDILVEVL